ncbi:MAG TPA: porin family protein [Vicinamibacterales bacterium]|nr:porin family protein [Vicinamibacterales bacterium]
MSIRRVARALFAAAVLLIPPASGFAQEVGVKAGVNFASLTPEEDESPDTSRRRGLVAGVWFRTASTTRFSFQAEGLFSEKGVKFDRAVFDVDTIGSVDVRVRYIEIPLLARAEFGAPGSATRVFVVGGAAPAFKLSGRATAEVDGEEQTVDTTDDIEPLDLGLVGGLGVEFRRALIEVRYTHGLLKINKDDNDPNDSIQNRVFSVTVGFRFR